MTYIQCHFCNSTVDLDLFLLQAIACKMEPVLFVTVFLQVSLNKGLGEKHLENVWSKSDRLKRETTNMTNMTKMTKTFPSSQLFTFFSKSNSSLYW